MDKKTIVCCLPKAGEKNPYQKLMMKGLQDSGTIDCKHGILSKIFPFRKTIKAQKPDYLHLDWIESYYYRRAAWMRFFNKFLLNLDLWYVGRSKTKLVWTLHNLEPHEAHHKKIGRKAYRKFAHKCDWIRVFDQKTADAAAKLFGVSPNKFKVVPEGSFVEFYPERNPQVNKKGEWGIGGDETCFVFVGMIKKYKGILNSIRVMKDWTDFKWKYVIIGECNDVALLNEIKEQAVNDDRIIFEPGFIDDQAISDCTSAADYVLLPYEKIENSGSAILAMGYSKAVIAPSQGVLLSRLNNQPQLLYQKSLDEVHETVKSMTALEREEIGKKNFEALKRHQWKDFSVCFHD